MSGQILVTDDFYRPLNNYGSLIPPTPKRLSLYRRPTTSEGSVSFIEERYVDWYTHVECQFNTNSDNLGAQLIVQTNYDMTQRTGGIYAWVRILAEVSTDDFNTVLQSTYIQAGNLSTDETGYFQDGSYHRWVYYDRNDTRTSEQIQLHCMNWCGGRFDLIVSEGVEYKVRLTTQSKTGRNGQWVAMPGATIVYTSVMPMSQLPTITFPSTVYMNRVNTFGMHIDQKYTTEFEVRSARGNTTNSQGNVYNYYTSIATVPVRNEQYPYITSGTTTEVLYWFPQISKNSIANSDTEVDCVIRCSLSVVDPSDTDYLIEICQREIEMTAVWASEDDTSALTASYETVDSPQTVTKYGALLRNIGQTLTIKVSIVAKYGIYVDVSYRPFYSSSYVYIVKDEQRSGTYEATMQIESGTQSTLSAIISVRTIGYVAINNQTVTFNVLDYYIPAFPNLAVHRCDEDGSENDSGDHCKIEWSVSIVPLGNHNSKILLINHPEGATLYDPLDSYTESGVLIVAANTESSYNIVFTLTDDMNSEKRTLVLSSAGVIMDWLRGGRGVSFGKVSSKSMAVEVGEMWRLICYKLLLSGTDVNAWMKEVIARLNGIEQFASNLGSTSQYQVTFYNDSAIVSRQWIRSGENAKDPDVTVEREPTDTASYSFAGWSLTKGATSADPNALKNITSYRSIYAAFTSTTRYYAVFYYNGGNLIGTVNSIQFHGNASYSGSTPTSDDGVFVGWKKSGLYVSGNTDAYAQFYDDTEITDSWEDIVRSCADGSYAEKYKQGNWKMLDLGTYGNIKMRIKGFRIHYGLGMRKIPISWEADTKLATNFRIGPPPEFLYGIQTNDGFTFNRLETWFVSGVYNYFYDTTWNAPGADRKAVATFTITGVRACSFYLAARVFKYDGGTPYGTFYWHIKATKNGEVVTEDDRPSNSWNIVTGVSGTINEGETVTIVLEAYTELYNSSVAGYYTQLRFQFDPDVWDNNVSCVNIDLSTNKVDGLSGVRNGTGSVGGFVESELHQRLQDDIKPLFPEALRKGLKTARIVTSSIKSSTEFPLAEVAKNDVMQSDLFIPSSDEILGAYENITDGVDFNVIKYQYRKKQNTSSVSSYWCRDTYGGTDTYSITRYFNVVNGYSSTDGNASRSGYPSDSTRPVYICFCT